MNRIEMEINDILQAEITVYEDILLLEEEKGRAIISRDGKLIEELSLRQEALVTEIDQLEAERISAAARFSSYITKYDDSTVTLRDIARTLKKEKAELLLKTGENLKGILMQIKEKQSINSRMIQDNIDFFNILISDLKNSSSIKSGYGRDGRENSRTVNPVLFNKRA